MIAPSQPVASVLPRSPIRPANSKGTHLQNGYTAPHRNLRLVSNGAVIGLPERKQWLAKAEDIFDT
jgi:hypothetical protein